MQLPGPGYTLLPMLSFNGSPDAQYGMKVVQESHCLFNSRVNHIWMHGAVCIRDFGGISGKSVGVVQTVRLLEHVKAPGQYTGVRPCLCSTVCRAPMRCCRLLPGPC